jgi:serine/threonine-protein kinase HipA
LSFLPVYFESRTVGTIEIGVEGPTFLYDPGWLGTRGAFPLSITMPLSTKPVKTAVFLPWAQNLLPEGAQLRTIGSALGASPDDVIAILAEIGRDTAGALSIGEPGSTSPGNWKPIPQPKTLERILNELPSKPFLAGEDGVSMSLAGVQNKLGVAIDAKRRICIPLDGAPSTHILKPDSEKLYGGVQNEALCLILAKRCGLNAPDVTTGKAGGRTYLLVTRYDRLQQGQLWRRQHQEDYCQALGKPPAAKYEANQTGIKGPALIDMFALTRNAMSARDVLSLLDYVIFNVLACNTDAHAKNYSLMISGRGFSLAPIYDVMCAAAWPNVTRNLAQKIADKNRGDHLKGRHWERFAEACGLNKTLTLNRVAQLCSLALKELDAAAAAVSAMPAGSHGMMGEFTAAIAARARSLNSGLKGVERAISPATTNQPKPQKIPRKRGKS